MRPDQIVEFHRPMEKRALAVPLIFGAILMTIGGLLVLLSLPRATAIPMLAILGGACIVCAPVSVLFSLLGRATVEKCLLIRRDAIVMQRGDEEVLIGWDDIDSIRCVDERIDIARKDGSIFHIDEAFSKPSQIAERMEEVRRKAGFGLI
jgi:hypothetical protein